MAVSLLENSKLYAYKGFRNETDQKSCIIEASVLKIKVAKRQRFLKHFHITHTYFKEFMNVLAEWMKLQNHEIVQQLLQLLYR